MLASLRATNSSLLLISVHPNRPYNPNGNIKSLLTSLGLTTIKYTYINKYIEKGTRIRRVLGCYSVHTALALTISYFGFHIIFHTTYYFVLLCTVWLTYTVVTNRMINIYTQTGGRYFPQLSFDQLR